MEPLGRTPLREEDYLELWVIIEREKGRKFELDEVKEIADNLVEVATILLKQR